MPDRPPVLKPIGYRKQPRPPRSALRLLSSRPAERRKRFWLTMHPLCAECERNDRVEAATELDHIIELIDGGADDESNLQGLCHACHVAKSTASRSTRRAGGGVKR